MRGEADIRPEPSLNGKDDRAEGQRYRGTALFRSLDATAESFEKRLFRAELKENPVYFVLQNLLDLLSTEGDGSAAKAIARASFIMIDEMESKIRYGMKKGRREALAQMEAPGELAKESVWYRNSAADTYELTIRRAKRGRKNLALTLEGVERFYMEHPYGELAEIIVSAARSLAHIDIMISLYEEEMKELISSEERER